MKEDGLELLCKINNARTGIEFNNKDFAKAACAKFKDKPIMVQFKAFKKNRSAAQNRWLWGPCYGTIISWTLNTFGEKYTKDEIHAYVCTKILGMKYEVKEILGNEVIVMTGIKTSKMTTQEFMDAKEKIQTFYAPKGCYIPDPRDELQ